MKLFKVKTNCTLTTEYEVEAKNEEDAEVLWTNGVHTKEEMVDWHDEHVVEVVETREH